MNRSEVRQVVLETLIELAIKNPNYDTIPLAKIAHDLLGGKKLEDAL